MNKNSEANKNRIGVICIWAFVIALFGSVAVMLTISFVRLSFVKKYTLKVGDLLGGNSQIYSEHNGEILQLNRQNVVSIAKISASGSIIWGSDSDELTGNLIKLTSVLPDTGDCRYVYIEEMIGGRTRITLEEGQEKTSAVLNDIRYANFLKCIKKSGPRGDNTPVDSIP